jgi:hypothetical protein
MLDRPSKATGRSVPGEGVFPFRWAESTSCRAPGMPACVQAIAETVGKDSALKNTKAVSEAIPDGLTGINRYRR